jgi:hypothetical protein
MAAAMLQLASVGNPKKTLNTGELNAVAKRRGDAEISSAATAPDQSPRRRHASVFRFA